jgi:hypothetical protein
MPRRLYLAFVIFGLQWAQSAGAHHSYSEYDDQQAVEFEGKLVDVAWQNPHVRFTVQSAGPDSRVVTWDIESTSLNALRRMQVPLEILKVGGNVKFAGWPSRQSPNRIYATHLLAPDGQEVVLWRYSTPRWASTALGYGSEQAASRFQGGVASSTNSLFRVWATDLDDLPSFATAYTSALPLTESARTAQTNFNPVVDTISPGCTPKGMPIVMLQPPPMELIDRGETILLRTEEYDTVRTINLTRAAGADDQPKSLLGYSIGHWEGETLVVETSRVNAPYLTTRGAPLGPSARFVERFTPTPDGSRLDYTVTITYPDSLRAPAELKRWWVSRPGEQVLPFNCGERLTTGQ